MAALLMKYLKDPAGVPALTKTIREKTSAAVPVTE